MTPEIHEWNTHSPTHVPTTTGNTHDINNNNSHELSREIGSQVGLRVSSTCPVVDSWWSSPSTSWDNAKAIGTSGGPTMGSQALPIGVWSTLLGPCVPRDNNNRLLMWTPRDWSSIPLSNQSPLTSSPFLGFCTTLANPWYSEPKLIDSNLFPWTFRVDLYLTSKEMFIRKYVFLSWKTAISGFGRFDITKIGQLGEDSSLKLIVYQLRSTWKGLTLRSSVSWHSGSNCSTPRWLAKCTRLRKEALFWSACPNFIQKYAMKRIF